MLLSPEDHGYGMSLSTQPAHAAAPTRLDSPVLDVVVPVYNEEIDLEPCVRRLHAWLQQRDANDRLIGVRAPVVTQVWIAPDGQVRRIEFATLGEAQADADLRALLTRRLAAPPPDMRQPIVLQLSLDPAPADAPGGAL